MTDSINWGDVVGQQPQTVYAIFDPTKAEPVYYLMSGNQRMGLALNLAILVDGAGSLSSDAVTPPALTAGQVLIGNGTGMIAHVLSGDATMTSGGAVTIATAPATG